jgi:hypothetical protein
MPVLNITTYHHKNRVIYGVSALPNLFVYKITLIYIKRAQIVKIHVYTIITVTQNNIMKFYKLNTRMEEEEKVMMMMPWHCELSCDKQVLLEEPKNKTFIGKIKNSDVQS